MMEIDTYQTEEIICPFCAHEYSDSWEYHDYRGNLSCNECRKEFYLEVNFDVSYSTSKNKDYEDD